MARELKTDDVKGGRYVCKVLVSKYQECGRTYASLRNLQRHIGDKHGRDAH